MIQPLKPADIAAGTFGAVVLLIWSVLILVHFLPSGSAPASKTSIAAEGGRS